MRSVLLLFALILPLTFSLPACKSVAKAAAKHWTKKQIKSFKKNCKEKVKEKFGEEKSIQFCDCAVGTLSEKYPDAAKAEALSKIQLLAEAAKCAMQN